MSRLCPPPSVPACRARPSACHQGGVTTSPFGFFRRVYAVGQRPTPGPSGDTAIDAHTAALARVASRWISRGNISVRTARGPVAGPVISHMGGRVVGRPLVLGRAVGVECM